MRQIRASYDHTIYACYLGYITQAIVNNFAPLLFLTFRSSYGIPLEQITLLVTLNFGVQLTVDFLSARFVDKIGYRVCVVAAHVCAALGLVCMGTLPQVLSRPFAGLCLSVVLYAIGGGLIEVLVSPIVEACPTEHKEAAMSLLHSFYCWGHMGVVLLSTLYFTLFGVENWPYLAFFWAVLPAVNAVYFSQVPIQTLVEEGEGLSIGQLLRSKLFWVLFLLMVCSGAAEQSMSQWASTFAEDGLQVSKTIGDLAGPCLFALLMGSSRAIYGKLGERLRLEPFMAGSAVLCVVSYLLACFSGNPALALLGCGLCGFSVGILWPGTFSIAAKRCPAGGTALFALLALGGDVGCGGGPTLVGLMTGVLSGNLKRGLLFGILFPVLLLLCLWLVGRMSGKRNA
ncbi:MAG: MFS transporter [Clostridiales bacterium]|nr:MFS transporter [Clostridiales bacterium]